MQSCGFGPKNFQIPSLLVAWLSTEADTEQAEKPSLKSGYGDCLSSSWFGCPYVFKH